MELRGLVCLKQSLLKENRGLTSGVLGKAARIEPPKLHGSTQRSGTGAGEGATMPIHKRVSLSFL